MIRWSAKLSGLFFCVIVSLSGCSRRAENIPLLDAGVTTGPSDKDIRLELEPLPMEQRKAALRVERATLASADYLRLVESLQELGKRENDGRIQELAKDLYDSFYRASGAFSKTSLARSPYADAASGEGELMVRKELDGLSRDLKSGTAKMIGLLQQSEREFPWPASLQSLEQSLDVADGYVHWLLKKILSLGMGHTMEQAISSAIVKEFTNFRPTLAEIVTGIERVETFADGLRMARAGLDTLGVKLTNEQAAVFRQADALAAELAAVESAQDTLTLLVHIWGLLPTEGRAAFQHLSPELYNFFSTKSEAELRCLAASFCANPVLAIAKQLVILPKIQSIGPVNIRAQVDSQALAFLQKTAREEAVAYFPRAPAFVKSKVEEESRKYQALVRSIQSDFGGFARSHLERWSSNHFNDSLRGIEVGEIKLSLASREKIRVSATQAAGDSLRTGADVIGMSMTLAHEFLPEGGNKLRAALLEPVLKLLAIGGYRQAGGKTFPGMMLALNGKPTELFQIKDLLRGTLSFAVPDAFAVRDGFVMDRKSAKASSSVASQAELLRGIARQLRFHRDWEKNQFDEVLGGFLVDELVPEVPAGTVNFPLFPKDIVFALAMGNAGGILQNIIRELSPAFLLLDKNELLWGNRYKEIGENGKISVVAGMVPIVDGKRANLVKTADIARYILALDEFIAATEGVEQTKAAVLLEKAADGTTVLEQLLEARRYLRLFQMGLTNYLVHVAKQQNGNVFSEYALAGGLNNIYGTSKLVDQALAIRALLASAKSLELPVLRWAALDIYYGMNRTFFDRQRQFYSVETADGGRQERVAGIQEIALTLLAGEELSDFMPNDTRAQWERMARPWIRALQEF